MKKLTVFILSLVFILALCGCKPDGTTDTPKLGEISNYTQEQLDEKLLGLLQEELHNLWGEPDGMLSGLYGDIWVLDKESGKEIIIYYDRDGMAENIIIYNNESLSGDSSETLSLSSDPIQDFTTPAATSTPVPSPTPTMTPTPTVTPTPTPEVIELTISAVGDVTLGVNQKTTYPNSFNEYYDLYGADYFMKNVVEVFSTDSFTVVNLEGTLTNSDTIRATKEWNHKGRPEYVEILKNASVEAVSLGNNHIMDYQQQGAADTIQNVADAGLTYAISGPWGDHYGLHETAEGILIGLVSVNEYYDGNTVYKYLEEGLTELRAAGADLVFALTHWGGDKTHVIEKAQYEMGHWCIDQGYDLVLGCHPHVIQGIECYHGKYIVYSMGNFCYGGNKNPSDKDSMIFQQTFTFIDGELQEETSIRAIPCRLSSVTSRNDYCPTLLTGEEAETWADHLNKYSEEFGLSFDAEGYLRKEE